MKNLTHFALASLLFCLCRKVSLLATPGEVVPEKQLSSAINNAGNVFSGTTILRERNLFTFLIERTSMKI